MQREISAITLMVVACCVASWMMLVSPVAEEASALESEVSELKAALSEGAVDAEDLAARAKRLDARLADIHQRGSFATDSTRIYTAIKDLAARHGLTVSGIDVQVEPPNAEAEEALQVTTTVFAVAVAGRYQDVAEFLDAVDRLEAFTRVSSLAIQPLARESDGGVRVHAKVSFQAMSFRLRPRQEHEDE